MAALPDAAIVFSQLQKSLAGYSFYEQLLIQLGK
jgi:hypothetical protein